MPLADDVCGCRHRVGAGRLLHARVDQPPAGRGVLDRRAARPVVVDRSDRKGSDRTPTSGRRQGDLQRPLTRPGGRRRNAAGDRTRSQMERTGGDNEEGAPNILDVWKASW